MEIVFTERHCWVLEDGECYYQGGIWWQWDSLAQAALPVFDPLVIYYNMGTVISE